MKNWMEESYPDFNEAYNKLISSQDAKELWLEISFEDEVIHSLIFAKKGDDIYV